MIAWITFVWSILWFLLKIFICFSSIFSIIVVGACKYLKTKYLKKPIIRKVLKNGVYKNKVDVKNKASNSTDFYQYDVVIAGGGPGGSTCSYYLADKGISVAVLERKIFPRDKICGDAICVPSMRLLKDMGIMEKIVKNEDVHFSDAGGFVSPSGLSYIGKSVLEVGEPLAGACKRIVLDEYIAKNAEEHGAELFEDCEVQGAEFDVLIGLWTVETTKGKFRCRVLIGADGAHSSLGRKLGIVTEPPKGVCSRSYIKGGTHNANLDGIIFYPPHSLPGYCAAFRHVKDELNFVHYLIPCGDHYGDCYATDLPSLHKYSLEKDPFISRLIGPKAEIEPMKVAPLRVNCQGVTKTYMDHFMLIGDAAGMIDPLTGEGIHNAMLAGRDAAITIEECLLGGDFSSTSLAQYEDRWMTSFGHDFSLSAAAVKLIWKFPILIDGIAYNMQKNGDAAFADWAKVMTMLETKDAFLEPLMAIRTMKGVLSVAFNKYILNIFRVNGYNYSYRSTWARKKL